RVLGGVDTMPLAGGEGDERAGRTLDVLAGDLDRDAATDDVHDGALAYVVVAHRLATLELDRDSPALRRAEEDARNLALPSRNTRRVGARLTRMLLLRRGRQRRQIPALHGARLTRAGRNHRPRLEGRQRQVAGRRRAGAR